MANTVSRFSFTLMGLLLPASLVQGSETFGWWAMIDMALHNHWHTNTDFSEKVADDLTDWVDMIVKKVLKCSLCL